MVGLLQYAKAVPTLHVAVVAVIKTPDVFHRHLSTLHTAFENTELSASCFRGVRVHLSYYLPGIRQPETGLEVNKRPIHPDDVSFLGIDFELSFGTYLDQFSLPLLQFLHVRPTE